jgi:hypothetical protein
MLRMNMTLAFEFTSGVFDLIAVFKSFITHKVKIDGKIANAASNLNIFFSEST